MALFCHRAVGVDSSKAGSMPPAPKAVKVAAWYDDRMDVLGTALRLQALPLHPTLQSGSSGTEYVLLRVQAPTRPSGPQPRLSAVIVLDVSGSMQGTPLAQVKDSVDRLASILGDEDSLGVVAFSTSAQTVAPIRKLTSGAARRDLQEAIHTLEANGYTNISAGMSHASLLFGPRSDDERQLILLLSDGQPNVGTQTASGLGGESELIKGRSIAVSTLGFGSAHNEDILLKVADGGGGRYGYVKDPLMSGSRFASALGAQRDVVIENLCLTLSPGPGVEITRILGEARTAVGDGGLRVSLSDLLLGEELNIVAELKVHSRRESGRWRLLRALLSGQLLGPGRPEMTLREEVTVHLSPQSSSEVDPRVHELVVMSKAQELRQRARAFADQRNFVEAAVCLRQARAALLAVHKGVPPDNSQLRDFYETVLDELEVAEKAPLAAEYSVLRKTQIDQQSTQISFTRPGTTLTPSATHMAVKLQGTHGLLGHARLVMIDGKGVGTVVDLGAECRIGRGQDNNLVLADHRATRRHTLIQWVGGRFVAHDLGSSNGTFVNGRHIVDDCALSDGDVISIGQTKLRFEQLDKKDL